MSVGTADAVGRDADAVADAELSERVAAYDSEEISNPMPRATIAVRLISPGIAAMYHATP